MPTLAGRTAMVMMKNSDKRYANSEAYLDRATQVIPLGSQTFSKSITQYPVGVSPLALARGKGSRVWDVDGHEYLDFVNALLAVSLGYADPDVDRAVTEQLALGTIFSLPHPLEAEVAELICECVPSAEMVRFGKNGSDATAGAVRLARAYTNRDHVLVCGYHGWQDWFIGSTPRNRGVPEATRALTHAFPYNDLSALSALMDKYAGTVAVRDSGANEHRMAEAWLSRGRPGALHQDRRAADIRRNHHRFSFRHRRRAGAVRDQAGSHDTAARGSPTDFRFRLSAAGATS